MRSANKVMKIPETHTSSTFSKKTSKGPESAVFVPESAVSPTYNLEVSSFFRNFAKTMEVFLRVWAAAQQSSSELGSAFLLRFTTQANKFERALHHPCTCKRNTANTGKTASTPTLSSPITLQLPSHRSPCRPSPVAVTLFSLFFTTIYNTRSLTYSPPFRPPRGTRYPSRLL